MRVMSLLPISPWAARVSGWPLPTQRTTRGGLGRALARTWAATRAMNRIARAWDDLAISSIVERGKFEEPPPQGAGFFFGASAGPTYPLPGSTVLVDGQPRTVASVGRGRPA